MPDEIQYRFELALEENRALRAQLAEVQRAFEHHVLDGAAAGVSAPRPNGTSRRSTTAGTHHPSALVRMLRSRLAGTRTARGGSAPNPAVSGAESRPRSVAMRRECTRLRAEAALADEKAKQAGVRLDQAESRRAALEGELARSAQALGRESERVRSFSGALEASQKLLQQLGGLMEKRQAEADERDRATRERLDRAEERFSAERVERLAAQEAVRAESERSRETEARLGQERSAHRAVDAARREAEQRLEQESASRQAAEAARQEAERRLEEERASRQAAEAARLKIEEESIRLRARLTEVEAEAESISEARRQIERARQDDAESLGRLRERLERCEGELERERSVRAAAERAQQESESRIADLRQRLEQVEAQLGTERDARAAAEQAQQEHADARGELQGRVQRVESALESEREGRRAAEQARILDAENLDELRQRYAEQVDRLAERDQVIEELSSHVEAAWTSIERLVDGEDLSAAILAELIEALRVAPARRAPDDA